MKNRRKTLREQNKQYKKISQDYFKHQFSNIAINLIVLNGILLSYVIYNINKGTVALVSLIVFLMLGGIVLLRRVLRKG